MEISFIFLPLSHEDVKGRGGISPYIITHNCNRFSNYDTVNMLVKAGEPLFSRLCRAYVESHKENIADTLG
jgi:hypothetical protein